MAIAKIENISIEGISCALPLNKVKSTSRVKDFGQEAVEKIINKTGVESIYRSTQQQTASDLAFVAAKNMIEQKELDVGKIKILVLVTQTPDYRLPATACVLQHRLGLPEDCICFDINLGCSGYINGLFAVSSLMKSGNIPKALLLVAETPTKRISPLDRSLSMLFGDCGTATLLEKTKAAAPMSFKFKSFGGRFNKIIVPAGAYRNLDASRERTLRSDGNIRSDYDTYMNGQDVFSFSITEVPEYIIEFMKENRTSEKDYDFFVLHQANQYILKQISKKLRTDPSKVPVSMRLFGNTGSTSIPLTSAFVKALGIEGKIRLLMSGFGIGLSWCALDLYLDTNVILPIIHTDDFYTNGAVSHE
jgi:3-oxoacyl-[acyl-carrier-protein] synthase-3